MSTPKVLNIENVRFITEEHSDEGRFRSDIHTTSSDRWVIAYEWHNLGGGSPTVSTAEVFASTQECLSWLRATPYDYLSSFAMRAANTLTEALL